MTVQRRNGEDEKIVILGAGITGLTLAQRLSERFGNRVVVIEKESFIGGLSATLHKEDISFDLGSHRLHMNSPASVLRYLNKEIGIQLMKRPRKGVLYFKGKFLRYPPAIFNLLKVFSLKKSIKFIISYLKRFFVISTPKKIMNSYEDIMIRSVGKEIYVTFYRDFAKKLWGMHPKEIAAEGVERRSFPVFKMLTRSIFNQSNYFFYPKEGIGEIARKIQESILRNNGTIIHGAKVRDISMNDNRISHIAIDDLEGKRVSMGISLFVSTTPIDSFFEMLFGKNEATPNLKWRDVRIIYIYLDKILERENETFYFPGLDIRFGRVSDIRRYSPYLNTSLEGTLLTVEIACSKDDDTWKMSDEELLNLCLPDLIKVNIIKKEARVLRYFSLILEKAYPIYVIDWKEKFSQIYSKLNAIENLFTIGRRGLFLHCNIDHCIIQGLVLGDFIIKNKRRDKGLWNKEASSFFSFSARD